MLVGLEPIERCGSMLINSPARKWQIEAIGIFYAVSSAVYQVVHYGSQIIWSYIIRFTVSEITFNYLRSSTYGVS